MRLVRVFGHYGITIFPGKGSAGEEDAEPKATDGEIEVLHGSIPYPLFLGIGIKSRFKPLNLLSTVSFGNDSHLSRSS